MVTVKDVAKDAGVALGTVSKVINGIAVGDEYKERVECSIEKLGYKVNIYARGLKAQRTNTIAVIIPDLINAFFALCVQYIEAELSKKDIKLLLCISNGYAEKELAYIEMASQNKVDGIIGLTYSDIDKYVVDDMPFVSIDRHFKSKIQCVCSDNYKGGELAAQKLVEFGCKNLLYFRTGSNIEGETLKRAKGFETYCKQNQLSYEICDLGTLPSGLFTDASKDYILEHLGQYRKNGKFQFDGIFTSSDYLALLLVELLKKFGISIPEDVQIIGFDGLKVLNEGMPLVSSIEQPIEQLAVKCVENVLKLIAKEEVEPITILPVQFIKGRTTK